MAVPIPPIGSIIAYAGPINAAWEVANGWLLCDGRSLNRTAGDSAAAPYMPLFNAIGSSWGGDGVDNFNIPDMQGRFLRGVNNGSGRDPDAGIRTQCAPGGHGGDQVGSLQPDQVGPHNHGVTDPGHGHGVPGFDTDGDGGLRNGFPRGQRNNGTDQAGTGISVNSNGTTETRPRNVNVYWIIRYK